MVGQGLRSSRCARGFGLRRTPGLRMPSGSSIRFTRSIAEYARSPHSVFTKGAMLRPEPCSALIAPSYLWTTRSTRLCMNCAVALDRLGAPHVLGQHEVEVAVLGVAEDHGVRDAVALEERLEVEDGLGETRDGHRHVLGEEGGSRRPHRPRARGEALAEVPEGGPLRLARGEPGRLEEAVAPEDRLRVVDRSRRASPRPPGGARRGGPRGGGRSRTAAGARWRWTAARRRRGSRGRPPPPRRGAPPPLPPPRARRRRRARSPAPAARGRCGRSCRPRSRASPRSPP